MQGIVSPRFLLGFAALSLMRKTVTLRRERAQVGGASRGDRAAFDKLVALHTPALRRFVARRVNEYDCDDIVQETWLAVWENLHSFDGDAKFKTWVFAVCFHKIQDHWRREMRRPPSAPIVNVDGLASYMPSEFSQIELREAIRTMWVACSENQRDLLVMYYSDGLTLPEISRVTGRNLNTIKYQFYRAHDIAAQVFPTDDVAVVCPKERVTV